MMRVSIIWLNMRLSTAVFGSASVLSSADDSDKNWLIERKWNQTSLSTSAINLLRTNDSWTRRATPGNQMHLNVTRRSSVRLQVPNFLCACVMHTWSEHYHAHACCTHMSDKWSDRYRLQDSLLRIIYI